MRDVNKAILVGRVGSELVLRSTQKGTSVTSFSLATETFNRDKQENETTWHRVVVWGKPAETYSQTLQKGMPLFIEGKIKTRKYEDQEGKARYMTEVHADNVLALQTKVGASAPAEAAEAAEALMN